MGVSFAWNEPRPIQPPSAETTEGDDASLIRDSATTAFVFRSPALPVVVCLAAGIVLDRLLGIAWVIWLGAASAFLLGWLAGHRLRSERAATVLLLASCVCLGGARHHQTWSVGQANDISLFAGARSTPVRVVGQIVAGPSIRSRPSEILPTAIPRYQTSYCTVECRWVETLEKSIPVTGRVRVSIAGQLLHVEVGDDIEVIGQLVSPSQAANPGQFDYSNHLQGKGIHSLVYVDSPDAVRRLGRSRWYWLSRWSARLKEKCDFLFVKHLSEKNVPLASAMLLGERGQMPDEIRRSFAESGTVHILAVSGLHVGILAWFVWIGCRVFNCSRTTTALVVVGVVVAYAFITNGRPPVVRASILIAVAALAEMKSRRLLGINTLAISALVILLWSPADLFDAGTQLSFLAVTAILWSQQWRFSARKNRAANPHQGFFESGRWWWRWRWHVLNRWWSALGLGYQTTTAIWLLTAPWVMARFHLISPVGLLINVVLVPLVAGVLGLGFLFMTCCLMVPSLAAVAGSAFDAGLGLLRTIVEHSARIGMSHHYVPAPPAWWLFGYYGLLLILTGRWVFRSGKKWGWACLVGWTIIGLTVGLAPKRDAGLRCTFLSVGHGCAVLLEMPNGKTVLYDAGAIQSGRRAQQIVQGALWERGLTRIDALVISHADVDHFNGVPGLLKTVSVGSMLVSRPFLDFDQQSVVRLCECLADADTPIQIVGAGDRLQIDASTEFEILHPGVNAHGGGDNQNSIVLLITYAGRRILLTGDLEGDGTRLLLSRQPVRIDVLLSPHHGSAGANTSELARWASPDWVVISAGRRGDPQKLKEIYATQTRVLSTARCGAITFEIEPSGRLHVDSWLECKEAASP